ncbi:MAG: DUF1501 domain-containing protein [Saprospiraceae bacterium]|nr:DUF1501 domain-containing protein [Saprospiraceae bacterium]
MKKLSHPLLTSFSSCSNPEAHKSWSRRDFLQTLGLTGGMGLVLGGLPINAMASPLLSPPGGAESRILVLIRLKGGNDGLNTIVPLYNYGTYKSARPTIHISQNELIALNNDLAIPKTMTKLLPMWQNGAMKVVCNVGYSNHNLSHFTSSDIWNSANTGIETDADKSGWLARFMLQRQPDYLENLPQIPGAIKISSGSNIAYQNADRIDLAVNFNSPDKLIEIAERGFYYDTNNLPDACYYGDQIGFLRSILNITYKYAPIISDAFNDSTNSVAYSNNELSRQLAIVARLIKGKLGTRLYMVSLDGFDTHENQNTAHPLLMQQLSAAISEFYADLKAGDVDKDVLAVSFSEFGRRVAENAGGTDHGTAAPVLMFGTVLEGNGRLGSLPDLDNLDANGNLKSTTDFRSVYASLLESWLCVAPQDTDAILGESYDRLDGLGFDCSSTGLPVLPTQQDVSHKVLYGSDGQIDIEFTLSRPGPLKFELFAITGQQIHTISYQYLNEGRHTISLYPHMTTLGSGMYLYRLTTAKNEVSGKIIRAW